MGPGVARLSVNERVQHWVLLSTVVGALGTGLALGRPPGAGAAAFHAWHVAAGFGSLVLLAYHLLYLAVRSYVEGFRWATFPLRLTRADVSAALGELRHLVGAGARPEAGEYRVSQKLFYWWTMIALAALGVTGIGAVYWVRFGTLASLAQFAALHRSLGLLLLASLVWHLYGALTWEGRWWPEWSFVFGELDPAKAEPKVPGAWRRHLRLLEERASAVQTSPEQQERARRAQEKDEVQAELERGNACALEERYAEAVAHYRRALELYPGYSQARYNMARVLTRMGERQQAREAYQEFLATDPFHPLAVKAQEAIRELDAGGAET